MPVAHTKSTDNAPQPARPRVLVIDDSRVMRKAINKILKTDYDLLEADDGEKGWSFVERDEAIQVVITDVEMPRLDGYSLICRIRANDNKRISEVPVIVITGAQDDETKERAYACGATDFITKPIDAMQLRARVRAHAMFDQTTRQLADTEAALEEQAALDPLTQLSSRKYFLQKGAQDIAYTKRHSQNLSLIRLDIDKFRAIYKQHDDEAMDRLLIWFGGILTEQCRMEDTVARIGGSEFAVITPGAGHTQAAVLCARLLETIAATPFVDGGVSIPITASIGLVNLSHDKEERIEDLLNIAERCLDHAKKEGGNKLEAALRDESHVPLAFNKPEEIVIENTPEEDEQPQADILTPPLQEDWPEPETTVATKEPAGDGISIDQALSMLAGKEYEKLEPYLSDLFIRLLPLLKFGNNRLALNLGFAIEALKEKLSGLK